MAEPKKRLTSSRSGGRRSHLQAKKLIFSICPKCHEVKLPHQVCPNCGYYRGIDILKLEEKAKQKEERRRIRESEESMPSEGAGKAE